MLIFLGPLVHQIVEQFGLFSQDSSTSCLTQSYPFRSNDLHLPPHLH